MVEAPLRSSACLRGLAQICALGGLHGLALDSCLPGHLRQFHVHLLPILTMHAFLKKFGLFMAIQLVIAIAVLWSYRRQFPPQQNFLAASIDKQALIRTQAPPR